MFLIFGAAFGSYNQPIWIALVLGLWLWGGADLTHEWAGVMSGVFWILAALKVASALDLLASMLMWCGVNVRWCYAIWGFLQRLVTQCLSTWKLCNCPSVPTTETEGRVILGWPCIKRKRKWSLPSVCNLAICIINMHGPESHHRIVLPQVYFTHF